MERKPLIHLSRRERQIMDVLFRLEQATAAEIQGGIPDPPGYSAVRATLRILEQKGVVRHETEQGKHVYHPAVSPEAARRSALRNLVETFFEGSAAQAALALLGPKAKLSAEELNRLSEFVEKARKEGTS
ncbi:MAG: BlaI/MecI/CopY family transcriptional regulator [Bryobacteraceae bacterium]